MLKYEEQLDRLEELDDPLSIFDQYYSHLLASQADAVTVTRVLERATQTFVDDRRYRNDPRYLRLWLAYALRCREPEDIYAFLAMRSIAAELAGYYEEYAAYLERKGALSKAAAVLRAGVERHAQPRERLNKRWIEFCGRNPQRREERVTYRKEALVGVKGEELSFEEVRSKSWRRAGSILKASYVPPLTAEASFEAEGEGEDDLEAFEAGLGPVDPDDLTHISVYRDNTADLRELAKSVPKEDHRENYDMRLFDQFLGSGKTAGSTSCEGRNPRLSLIPEESDANTQATGLINSLLLRNVAPGPMTVGAVELKQMRVGSVPACMESSDLLQDRLEALEKSIGRDGIGHNHTVASLRIAAGHYFIERRLGPRVLLGIDLEADIAGSDLHHVVLKVSNETLPWEAVVLTKLAGLTGIPTLAKVCRHPDGAVFTESYYPHGSLAALMARTTIDEKLLLFWMRELVNTVLGLVQRGIVHGRLALEHVLVRLGPLPLLAVFDANGGGGWSDRGIALVGFSKSLDLAALPATAVLGETVFDEYAQYVEGRGNHQRILTLDIAGLLQLLAIVLTDRTLRYLATWDEARLALHALLLNDCSVDQVVAGLNTVRQIFDGVLRTESITLPTLKSLLTRLEISLLERNPS